ncbi:protein nutcracker isoform X1 [Drosophila obscura]|uniref:protein nutcracker isoform X1 n=1 Tax=Drosophila obscura TaxID=7282 RepID=UPI001BB2CDC6|nr:protein nutcracker isoform X1 [Drosophila obscura]
MRGLIATVIFNTAAGIKRRHPLENTEPPLNVENATPEAVPLYMSQLLDQCAGADRKIPPAELLTLLVYLVAMESGFVEVETYSQNRHKLQPVPAFSSFHAGNVRLLSLEPPHYSIGFNDTVFTFNLRTLHDKHEAEEAVLIAVMQSRLRAVHLGDELMVSLSPPVSSKLPGYSIALTIGRYVLNIQAKGKPIFNRFRKLDNLSYELKQNIFHPMRTQQLMQISQQLQPSLVGLPEDIYPHIFRYLNRAQLNTLGKVNSSLNDYVKNTLSRRKMAGI